MCLVGGSGVGVGSAVCGKASSIIGASDREGDRAGDGVKLCVMELNAAIVNLTVTGRMHMKLDFGVALLERVVPEQDAVVIGHYSQVFIFHLTPANIKCDGYMEEDRLSTANALHTPERGWKS